jgi:hypothetical protein
MSVIDLDRYPIDQPGPARDALIEQCRRQLAETGCVVLEGFVTNAALTEMNAEGRKLAPNAHFNTTQTNCYSSSDDDSLPEGHPKRVFMERTNGFVAGDLIGSDYAVRDLYENDALRMFVAACMKVDQIHEYGDPLGHLVFNVLRPGTQHPWHFDNNEFIVTLLTQRAEAGGKFEYCPRIRSEDDENIAAVGATLAGDDTLVHRLDPEPGSLQIFYGRHSLHRVTRIEGTRERHTLILGYSDTPGEIADAERTKRLFGRATEEHERAAREGRERVSV